MDDSEVLYPVSVAAKACGVGVGVLRGWVTRGVVAQCADGTSPCGKPLKKVRLSDVRKVMAARGFIERGVPANKKDVYTTGQIARICRVAPRTASKWIDSGKLAGYRIPGSNDRRVLLADLVKFLDSNGMPTWGLSPDKAVVLVGTCQAVEDAVRAAGFAAVVARTAIQAAVIAAVRSPHFVVVDASSGRSDMALLARHLRGEAKLVECGLIALMGEDEADPEFFRGAGYETLLQKPCDPASLVAELTIAATPNFKVARG